MKYRIVPALCLCLALVWPVPVLAAESVTPTPTEAPAESVTPTPTETPAESPTPTPAVSATVSLSDDRLQMNVNGTSRLRASTIPPDATISWSVTGENAENVIRLSATVGDTVLVTAAGPGQATVTASVSGGNTASCQVVVSGITLSRSRLELNPNGSETLYLRPFGDAANVPASHWEWSTSNTSVAIVQKNEGTLNATVTAISSGSGTVTCTGGGYAAICQIAVAANEASVIRASLTNGILSFEDILSQLQTLCRSMTGEELSYITSLSVRTDQAILYDGYASEGDTGSGVAGNRLYYVDSGPYQISHITFLPKAGATGNIVIDYRGFSPSRRTFTGTIEVEVEDIETTLSYASRNGAPVRFRAEDFYAYCMALYNRSMQYVTFTPPDSRYGALYYNYVSPTVYESAVSAGTRYFRTYNPAISNISFAPDAGYAGTFTIPFTGYDAEGNGFAGTVRIAVNNPAGTDISGGTSENRLSYETGPGARVSFRTADFNDECYDKTGYSLTSIQFTSLPSSSRGILYYNRNTRVSTEDEFYRSGSRRDLIGDLSFVADDDYTGSFTISFTGTNTKDKTFRGSVSITVSEHGAYTVRYDATGGERVPFSVSDFSTVCQDATGRDFDHLRFTALPASGSLYAGDTLLPAYTDIYRAGSRLPLESVQYRAPENYTGSVAIPYTAYDTRGDGFQGRVIIDVTAARSSSNSTGASLSYYYTSGPAVALRASGITAPAESSVGAVMSVKLSRPDPAAGRFVKNYVSPGQYAAFDETKEYPPEELEQVFFLPKAGFSGTVSVQFVARNRYGVVFSSILRFQVTPPAASRYFSDLSGRGWAIPAVDFFRYYNILNGVTATTYEPDGPARRGAFVTVLARMYGYPQYAGGGGYEDVDLNRYYAPSIAAARYYGIIDGGQYFYPDDPITRQDAAVYLYRALRRAGLIQEAGSYADLAGFSDWYLVSYQAVEAMGALVRLGVFTGNNGRLNPTATLSRLQMAAILYRAVA